MVDIKLNDGQTGYDVIGEYIKRYWDHNIIDTVIVSIGASHDGNTYDLLNVVADHYHFDDVIFQYDWWEGEKYIKLFGIKTISEIDVYGGIYTED